MTPFARLALLGGATVWAIVLILVNRYLGGWTVALIVAAIAVVVTGGATIELAPSSSGRGSEEGLQTPPSDDVGKQEARDFVMRRRDRADIERSAQRAADEA